MKWDVAFYVRNLPSEYRLEDRHFRMVDVGDRYVTMLKEGTVDLPDVQQFLSKPCDAKLTAVLFRLEADSEGAALELGKHQLAGFIDGFSVLLDRNLPEVCSLVEIRRERAPDSKLIQTGEPGWAYFASKDPGVTEQWRKRNHSIFMELIPFFDLAAEIHPRGDTSLGKQILSSMKMYCAGARTAEFGVEFICKWSALEGLVCGGETKNKGATLRARLSSLVAQVGDEETGALVGRLWKFRSSAVHEAFAFRSGHLQEAPLLSVRIELG